MRGTMILVAVLCSVALAADDVTAVPNPSAGSLSAVIGRQSPVVGGTEAITIPQMLSYQGKLTDTLGQPVPNGNYPMMFLLYTVPSGGSAFWTENQSVTVKNGLFSVLLGSGTPIDSVPSSGTIYLAMSVAGGPELTPRIRIGSAAFAYLSGRAANADLLQGKDTAAFDSRYVNEGQASSVTSNMMVDGTIAVVDLGQMGASSGQVMKWTGSAWEPRNDSVGESSGGTVTSVGQATGIVCNPNPITTTGTVGFDQSYGDGRYVNEGQSAGGDLASSTYPNPSIAAGAVTTAKIAANAVDSTKIAAGSIIGADIKDGTVSSADIRDTTITAAKLKDGSVTSPKIYLPYSGSVATTSDAFFVKNTQTSNDAPAIVGIHDTTDFFGVGVLAKGGWKGVEGYVYPTGGSTYYGAIGSAAGGSGTNYGVYGYAEGSGTNYGVWGRANGSGTNYAGYFTGDVTVTGILSKGGGSFQIDHPLDPLNKYLFHSFVESPDMMNVYNGNVVTDASGYATLSLPDWFETLNRDFRYQLTVIDERDGDGFAQAKVVRGVKDNSFVIRTSAPFTTVSWQVTGIRHDRFANANRIQVEVDKPAGVRGRYIHPEVYGQQREAGIGAAPGQDDKKAGAVRHDR